MPFQSENQRRFMWAKHPEIAKKWAHGKHSKDGNFKEAAKRRISKSQKK